MCEGIESELQSIDLGDKRLNHRGTTLLQTLAADPSASINAATGGWNETLAAYRFFDNPKVESNAILAAHREATQERIEAEEVVLVVQDTTELDFSSHPTTDSGVLNEADRFGLYDHSHLAFTPQRLCLGVLEVDFFSRTAASLGKARERKYDPIEEKESFRWLQGYRLACQLAREHPTTQIVSVADCECDIYDVFCEYEQQPAPADFVIRAKQNRRSTELNPDVDGRVYKKVRDEVAASELLTTREVELPRTPKREARTARLEIRAKTVTVKPPHMRDSLGRVQYNLVLVQEVGRTEDDETTVSWLLITSLPIDSAEAALRVVDYYVARWPIEVFFRVYKSGCRVEEIQLETNARQQRCLMLYKIIAWRIMYLTFLGRECPELPCDQMFADCEWKPVWKIVSDDPLPEEPPTLSEFIPMLAQLGGYNNRKHDHPPGPQAIWVGIRRMTDFALAWNAFGPENGNQ
jgi:hypothetical protein